MAETESSKKTEKTHLIGIDLIRFFAAFSVMTFHMAFWSWAPEFSTPRNISGGIFKYPEFSHWSSAGWVGVEIFFVISGFVIVYSANGTAWQFLRSRILRLVPGVWICAPITAILLLLVTPYSDGDIVRRLIRSLIFWPFPQWVDAVYWTLGIEIVFYSTVFILLMARLQKFLVPVLVALGCSSTLFWIIQKMTLFPLTRGLELTLLPHGCFFAIGGLLWAILCNQGSKQLWIVIAFSMLGGTIEIANVAIPRGQLAGSSVSAFFAIGLWVFSILAIIMSIRFAPSIATVFPGRLARTMGLVTYPLYLIHQTMGAAVLSSSASIGIDRWTALCLALILPVIVSLIIVKYVERSVHVTLLSAIDCKLFEVPRRVVDFRWRSHS